MFYQQHENQAYRLKIVLDEQHHDNDDIVVTGYRLQRPFQSVMAVTTPVEDNITSTPSQTKQSTVTT